MTKEIPNDLILFISGASCVGKTSVAHRLLEIVPEFRNVSEMDIIRTVTRAIVNNVEEILDLATKNTLSNIYAPLFKSTKNGNYSDFKNQAAVFINAVREIVQRQQSRKIPTIIEGINIIPSLYFNNNIPLEGFQRHIVFINLYLSDENIHIQRRECRCKERKYPDDYNDIINKVKKLRRFKNEELHQECCALSKVVKNVYSIETANKSIDNIANQILEIIFTLF